MPVDPFESFPFDLADRFPWTGKLDDLGLEQAYDAFGQGVIVAVSNAAHRSINPSLGQPFGISDRQLLTEPVAVMDQLAASEGARWQMARFGASRTNPVVIEFKTRQPTILRAKTSMMKGHYIAPGNPTQNAFIESFNGRLRGSVMNSVYLGWPMGVSDTVTR